jgi:hypothetical protein
VTEKNNTTHILIARQLVVYRLECSDAWQCRYIVDGNPRGNLRKIAAVMPWGITVPQVMGSRDVGLRSKIRVAGF